MNLRQSRGHRGAIAVVSLVCLAIALSLGATLLSASLRERLQGRAEHAARQADELVAAGAARATAALQNIPDYKGETWTPALPEALAKAEATVAITVDREAEQLRVAAIYRPTTGQPIRRSQDFPLPQQPAGNNG